MFYPEQRSQITSAMFSRSQLGIIVNVEICFYLSANFINYFPLSKQVGELFELLDYLQKIGFLVVEFTLTMPQ